VGIRKEIEGAEKDNEMEGDNLPAGATVVFSFLWTDRQPEYLLRRLE